jgi:hypothetical protein
MRQAISDFNRVTEQDMFVVKSTMARIDEHIAEATELIGRASRLRMTFNSVARTGKLFPGVVNGVK